MMGTVMTNAPAGFHLKLEQSKCEIVEAFIVQVDQPCETRE
jgi:hypothetical protein